MKRNIFLLLVSTTLLFSCSTDDNKQDDANDENQIIGAWQAREFKAADPNSSNVNIGAEILSNLTAEDCYILTFTFNEDLSLVAESSINYLELNFSATGLEVPPCPTESDTETSTYTYDGTTLTTVNTEGAIVKVKVSIEGDIMSADATDLDLPNFDGEGELIFEKI